MSTTIWDLVALVDVIRFKQVILNMDLETRKVVLEKSIELVDKETLPDLHKWFTECTILSERDNMQEEDRKREICSPGFWNRVYVMASIPVLREIAGCVSKISLTPPYKPKNKNKD